MNLLNVKSTLGSGIAVVSLLLPTAVFSYTRAGTEISTPATATFDFGSERITIQAPKWVDVVDELIDVKVSSLEAEAVISGSGSSNQVVRFEIINQGNGFEPFGLTVDNALSGDQFDPQFASIYLDDGDGTFNSVSDTLYRPGQNDPVLDMTGMSADRMTVFVLNHMPNAVQQSDKGTSQLIVSSTTATGTGTVIDGAGDAGTDVVVGFTEGKDEDVAEYLIENASVSATKSVEVFHPDHGVLTEAIPGATLRYTIRITVSGLGAVEDITFRDAIPEESDYTPGTLFLNGTLLTDPADSDAGEFDDLQNEVIARLGRLTATDGEQVVVFETTMKEVQP